jgi:tetratricopeptide (TPR) repeat protein
MNLEDYEAELALNMWAGNKDAAMENIKAIMELDPENLYGLLTQAYVRFVEGEEEEALDIYKNSLGLIWKHPDLEDEVLDTISRLSLKTGKYEDAKLHANRRIRLVGENNISRLIIALSSFSLNDDKDFEENLDRAMSMGVYGPAFQMKVGQLLNDKEKLISLYLKTFSKRSRYEQELWGAAWN